jgi:hypothetical protein
VAVSPLPSDRLTRAVMLMKPSFSWDVALLRLVNTSRRFRKVCCVPLHGVISCRLFEDWERSPPPSSGSPIDTALVPRRLASQFFFCKLFCFVHMWQCRAVDSALLRGSSPGARVLLYPSATRNNKAGSTWVSQQQLSVRWEIIYVHFVMVCTDNI